MRIFFNNKKLAKTLNSQKEIRKKYGRMSDKIMLRLRQIKAAQNMEELRFAPGKYHELHGDRKGQIACSLTGANRLIFVPVNDPLPVDKDGKLIWSEITEIVILEIEDYH